ncbi:hypothetical protein [Actinopolymorpha sp. B9G3]|uniref:hypothetical protein n=1 Tax=Actinopolymorpha sp. B9G3 TaxID=3158970 RepID=UPI0032D8F82F
MRIRLMGLPVECQAVVDTLVGVFDVVDVSDPYLNHGRSDLVRVYVTISTAELAAHAGAGGAR